MNSYLTAQQVAKLFGVTLQTVYRWVKSGKLRARKIGRTIRFSAEEIGQ